jgi:hypothetical protein
VTAKQPAIKKYVVKLSEHERDGLTGLIQKGKRNTLVYLAPPIGRNLLGRLAT